MRSRGRTLKKDRETSRKTYAREGGAKFFSVQTGESPGKTEKKGTENSRRTKKSSALGPRTRKKANLDLTGTKWLVMQKLGGEYLTSSAGQVCST